VVSARPAYTGRRFSENLHHLRRSRAFRLHQKPDIRDHLDECAASNGGYAEALDGEHSAPDAIPFSVGKRRYNPKYLGEPRSRSDASN
jgi:hypothetical protein